MIFKPCPNCKKSLTPFNVEKIHINELGLWMHHTECHGDAVIALQEVVRRSNEFAKGNPMRQIEIDFYKERLRELNANHT